NGTSTTYEHDPLTFRLPRLVTNRPGTIDADKRVVQDLAYTYDPSGNITRIRDTADIQNVVFFQNQRIEPSTDYTYDPLYRLVAAAGREHLGQKAPQQVTHDDSFRTRLPHPTDGTAMGTYTETYTYDAVGNILKMLHQVSSGSWTRRYSYAELSNRLLATSVPGDPDNGPYSEAYAYDDHGNMTRMPHLTTLTWDERDRLRSTARRVTAGTPEMTWYVYDAAGERLRKITDRTDGTRRTERLYLGGIEIYRELDTGGATVKLERETLHVVAGKDLTSLIESRTAGTDAAPAQLTRYQHTNHLGSAALELDDKAVVISYEEYFPYGSTAYQAVRNTTETPKRYRYTGKERDEESDLYYHGARYYAPWLGRWTACDPLDIADGLNLYRYVQCNPVIMNDPSGTMSWKTIAAIGAGLVIGAAVTVLTGGLAAPLIGTAASSIFAGVVGGAIGAGVGTAVETRLEKGKVDWGKVGVSALIGGATGGLLAGALGSAAGKALAQRIAASSTGQLLAGAARRAASSAVGRAYTAAARTLREPAERLGQAISERFGIGPGARLAEAARARAVATQGNVMGIKDVQREVSSAGGREFVHSTERSAIPETAAVRIQETGALRPSQAGASGQWGTGAYAYEGTLKSVPSSTGLQFRVSPQTAVETIRVPGQAAPIIRLVPPPGSSEVPVRVTGSGFPTEALDKARLFLRSDPLPRAPFGYSGVSSDVTGGTGALGAGIGTGSTSQHVPAPQSAVRLEVRF
ncbi:MAG: RHS repeat-associated core domain-containing protein, partial [Thermoanaerobaculia bacterium]